ncbi:DUF429 domain-containing protein [Aquisalimonas lutea]|uniref:DUF429 domain-containing protein n=1 Tax=Aquisalimonas lutea TaxID=1327750 RepID=UPI0025B49CCC|nr:DUF429 domain-containing protein [Aquisalimonas lutea]MDN3519793.1 DUF429 domain-containing protein [Aquisalimonas lutea]
MTVRIVGIDCATDARRVGYAFAMHRNGHTIVEKVAAGSAVAAPVDAIAAWLSRDNSPALLALDAPLGWPATLGTALPTHQAGQPLPGTANDLFRRHTDRFIRENIGKQSLDVGADRIARTAHAALQMLQGLRERLGEAIPLAWQPTISGVQAIEVYPAATLAAHGIRPTGYKAVAGGQARERVLSAVRERLSVDAAIPDIGYSSDGIDAVLCTLAARDFLAEVALPPEPSAPVETEGWIWVRVPKY